MKNIVFDFIKKLFTKKHKEAQVSTLIEKKVHTKDEIMTTKFKMSGKSPSIGKAFTFSSTPTKEEKTQRRMKNKSRQTNRRLEKGMGKV